ncbi:hypothetical protein [Kribbella pratensis]|uniref:hypothetical protein n=1 Tax=Kribbella pratensis TaxID=2512112 RepID=UPI001066D6BA|nr:hypothetical protein [Kribbella pratensis]
MKPRLHLVAGLLLFGAVAACNSVVNCSPCGGPVLIELGGLQPRPTQLQVCLDKVCQAASRLPADQPMINAGGPAVYDHSTITLHTYRNGRRAGTYVITDLTLRRPSGKGCDCGEEVALVPAPDGTLRRRPPGSPSPTLPPST